MLTVIMLANLAKVTRPVKRLDDARIELGSGELDERRLNESGLLPRHGSAVTLGRLE
jgi:hypothetical protein